MKKFYTLLAFALFASFSFAAVDSVNVTFRVNMSLETVSTDGVHLAGDVQGWNPATTAMTDGDSDGIYEVTLKVKVGLVQYKFINGNAWSVNETVPAACVVGGNRNATIGEADSILPAYCFSSCGTSCSPAPAASGYYFRVNMEAVKDSIAAIANCKVFLIAPFTSWQASALEMHKEDTTENIYAVYVPSISGAEILFKYSYGTVATAGAVEEGNVALIGTCAVDNGFSSINRTYTRTTADVGVTSFIGSCFNACDNACSPTGINESATSTQVTVSPNPFSTYTTVNLSGVSNTVSVYDVTGKLISSVNTSESSIKIYKNVLESGMYFLVVENNAGVTSTHKLIVE